MTSIGHLKSKHLPVVLSREEAQRLLACFEGELALVTGLLYGSGLRLMEAMRLRVKDVDFARSEILVRDGKGMKDRVTLLPGRLSQPLKRHLDCVKALHERDLAEGFGEVYLPFALARKYPNAAKEWGWQYIFPAPGRSVDPRSGIKRRHHMDEKRVQRAFKSAVREAGGGNRQAGHAAYPASLLRHPSAGERAGHSYRAGAAGPCGREDMTYTHVLNRGGLGVLSPLDRP